MFRSLLFWLAPPVCAACAEPLRRWALFCAGCAVSVQRSAEGGFAFDYGGAMAQAIVRFKYEDRYEIGPSLGALLAEHAKGHLSNVGVDVVVPVPLHPSRLFERGFNQAAVLAAPVAKALSCRLLPRELQRTTHTEAQARLGRAQRASNVAGAFSCRGQCRGKSVLLVDDVQTTGATLGSCAKALAAGGAARVYTLVLARATLTNTEQAPESPV